MSNTSILAKICAHPDLRLSDGSQAVWLDRHLDGVYVGGVVVERQPCYACHGDLHGEPPSRHEYRLEVEIKVGNEPQRPEQIVRMRSVRARGGCYVLARSVEDAVTQIKAFIERTDR